MILDLLWWLGLAWCAAWTAAPLMAVPALGPVAGAAVWVVMAPWTALLGMAAVHRVLPRSAPGRYRFPGDAGSIHWALAGWAPSVYLTLFQPLFFNNRAFQRLALTAFGARLGPGAWVTSRTVIREPHHVRIGSGTVVGEHAHLVCSYQPRPGLLLVDDIVVGDDCLIGAYSHIGPGATIGSRSIVEHGVVVGGWVRVGEDVRVGAGTAIYNRARIGKGASIGKNCLIPSKAVIADGARVPDGVIVRPRRSAIEREAAV